MLRKKRHVFLTDPFYKKLWVKLATDFAPFVQLSRIQAQTTALEEDNIAKFRELQADMPCFLTDVAVFKRQYQLDKLHKRYRFKNDTYTDEELESGAMEKFIATQKRIASLPPPTYKARLVLHRARSIVRTILGAYDEEEHFSLCRFGKRASVGVPLRQSYIDLKLGSQITGSAEHLKLFKKYLLTDHTLTRAIDGCVPMQPNRLLEVSQLALTNVPKSFKALRSIMPNTTVGGFFTYGLGKLIERRLRNCKIPQLGIYGLDIRKQQQLHRKVIKKYSKSLSHVTADLSAASDSFSASLINALVPRKWYNALKCGRISHCAVSGTEEGKDVNIYLSSFMTMGIGFTFPLQTLLFYALLCAIKDLAHSNGNISVYGDDLIYPRSMHRYVRQVFSDLGFILNTDKTFVEEPFRESCGEDYYYGYAVRPFNPEGSACALSVGDTIALLYKTVNGLLRRWDKHEIPRTLEWLYSQIMQYSKVIFQVPMSFPDSSGVQVDTLQKSDLFLKWSPIRSLGHGTFSFCCHAQRRLSRIAWWQQPYYWEALRSKQDKEEPSIYDDGSDILNWVEQRVKPWRSSYTHEKFKFRLIATTVIKEPHYAYFRQTGTAFSWTEDSNFTF